MKPIVFLLCLSLISVNVAAQRFSTGLRTGAGYWPKAMSHSDTAKGTGLGWSKSIYTRYESKGRFACELELAHNRLNYDHGMDYVSPFSGPSYTILTHHSKNDLITATASVQWRVTNSKSPVSSYVGAGASYGRRLEHKYYTIQDDANDISTEERGYTYGLTFCGLNNYTSYSINKHFNIHSALSFEIDPFHTFSAFYPAQRSINSRLTWSVGCGYRF